MENHSRFWSFKQEKHTTQCLDVGEWMVGPQAEMRTLEKEQAQFGAPISEASVLSKDRFSAWMPQARDLCLALQDLPWNCTLLVEGHSRNLGLCPVSSLPLGSCPSSLQPQRSRVDGILKTRGEGPWEPAGTQNHSAPMHKWGWEAPRPGSHEGKFYQ